MILISHRGNISGRKVPFENRPSYIDEAIEAGYDVEIDVWYHQHSFWLGHDYGQYEIDINWLKERSHTLWIHCKNHSALENLMFENDLHIFWHDEDDLTLTSNGFIWSHPKITPLQNSIAVLPEIHNRSTDNCVGICSDNIINYKK